MKSGCRWVYTLMDWDTGEVVAKGTSVELVEQGYFPDVNKLSSIWNNLEKCKNPSPKNYRSGRAPKTAGWRGPGQKA